MMPEEARLLNEKLYNPSDLKLKKIKTRTHNLCLKFNKIKENKKRRDKLVKQIFKICGDNTFIQNPMYIHYGIHTEIGKNFFANFNLTIQDDAMVYIGNNCSFGPNVTIVTPIHPLISEERLGVYVDDSTEKKFCYAKPVNIGNNCWLGANVTVCPGVTIGDGAVIGAGSVVTRNIPNNVLAVGSPCRVVREINENDSVYKKNDIF